jgi:ribose-phosphate pyrophosphokinase
MLVLGFEDSDQQAAGLAAALDAPRACIDVHRFPDGESRLRLPTSLPEHVILCRSLHYPNEKLVELMLAARSARALGARQITLVAPYLCYMRQDKAFHPGEAISQRIIGAFLARRLDALVTVDPHLHRVGRLDDAVPVPRAVATTAVPLMAEWLAGREGRPLIVGPDAESEQWVGRLASAGEQDYCVASKDRLGDRDVRITLPERDYRGREVVLVDDVASSGRTLAEAARQLEGRGAASVSALVTHALFADDALEHLNSAGVREIVSTDSIPHPSNLLRLDRLLAKALTDAWDTTGRAA